MWNLDASAPTVIQARVLTCIPDAFRNAKPTEWVDANKPGHILDSFLEGPAFDRAGNLYVTDIPNGRIFKVDAKLQWTLIANTGGWPNGIAIHADGTLWISDYRRGILAVQPLTGEVSELLAHRNSESFKGVNDLTFDSTGKLYFTDQGQTGLHDPTGLVYRWDRGNQQLDSLIRNAPSPNGLVLDRDGRTLFVAVTRANAVWRGPLLPDGSISKVGAFRTFFGTSGPDGMAFDADGRLVVAHASLGCAFVIAPNGEITHLIRSPAGHTITNVAFRPGSKEIVMTDSQTGCVLIADMPSQGLTLYSHQP